jgi:mycothione reductase
LKDVPYITSKEALRLKKLPKTMTVIGGGYIAAELAHFYGALGTKTTIIQRSPLMVKNEDETIAKSFTQAFSKNHNVLLGFDAKKVETKGGKIITTAASSSGTVKKIVGDQLLVAAGRVSNSDRLDVGKTGVKINKYGYVETNSFMETNVKNIWAFGDIAGKYFFKHSANEEAAIVVRNAVYGRRDAVNYAAMPHAIFSGPQVAGVGEREQDLKKREADYVVGEHKYMSTGMGIALNDKEGFARVYVERKTHEILGCHVMGTDASTMIHEVIVAMRHGIKADQLFNTVHIHPALSEVVQRAFGRLE